MSTCVPPDRPPAPRHPGVRPPLGLDSYILDGPTSNRDTGRQAKSISAQMAGQHQLDGGVQHQMTVLRPDGNWADRAHDSRPDSL
jgi:hypothetical protein